MNSQERPQAGTAAEFGTLLPVILDNAFKGKL